MSGVVLPFSIRLSVSGRMPARRANSAWVSPEARRRRMIFRANDTRVYSTAGYSPWASAFGSGGQVDWAPAWAASRL